MRKLLFVLILLPAFTIAQKNIVYHSLEVTYIGLNAADLVTTFNILESGGYEANPAMTKIVQNKPLAIGVKSLSTFVFLGGCRMIRKERPKLAMALLIIGNIGYTAVVYNNYQVSVRLKI